MQKLAKIRHAYYNREMPHTRARRILELFETRLRLFPVVGILGARQTGKSTFLRDILSRVRSTNYITLDRQEAKANAMRQPTLFIQNLEEEKIKTVCIDEIQKAPVLFDTIKAEVDEKKRPGRFAISGSTEFSKKTGVNESLTGRISLLRIFPLNFSEIYQKKSIFFLANPFKVNAIREESFLKHIQTTVDRGGMPGIFGIREKKIREALIEGWIETTCTRDLANFNIPRFNPDLARRILIATAKAQVPNRTEISHAVGRTPRQIEAYFQAFKAIFVFYEIEPYPGSAGKSYFYILDSGIAGFAGSSFERCFEIWFLNECFSQFSYLGEMHPDVFYYESTRGSRIDFVIQARKLKYAVKLIHEEAPSAYSFRGPEAFLKKHGNIPVLMAAPCLSFQKVHPNVRIVPWTALAV
ncbi:MAG: ATP-binding protein [Bdellovibrio sp.]|nr:ATP-binding protein [Bdellovibrio sp.]